MLYIVGILSLVLVRETKVETHMFMSWQYLSILLTSSHLYDRNNQCLLWQCHLTLCMPYHVYCQMISTKLTILDIHVHISLSLISKTNKLICNAFLSVNKISVCLTFFQHCISLKCYTLPRVFFTTFYNNNIIQVFYFWFLV